MYWTQYNDQHIRSDKCIPVKCVTDNNAPMVEAFDKSKTLEMYPVKSTFTFNLVHVVSLRLREFPRI